MVSHLKRGVTWLLKNAHYVFCIFVVLAAITSVGNFQVLLSKQTLSPSDQGSSVLIRFVWDAALLVGFMCQHTLMAASFVKDKLGTWLRLTISQRLLYTGVSSLTLLFCILKWQSIPEAGLWVIDTREHWFLWLIFLLLHVVTWLFWSLQVVLMDVGEMLGVSQIHRYYKDQPQPLTGGRTSVKLQDLYSHVRHPGTLLVTLLLWVHPLMTLDRFLLACWFSCYMIFRHSTTDTHYTFGFVTTPT
ncbi:hypothetical protein RRG08_005192 [Elysia crispata]|uniref:Nuclear envelope membrane protein n=1 Tax=Elysia crispata TaxID=231223 RepID=A0AAE1DG33_9GAST|nr:hypothetical protein RRG08_005192 [Elysia crispata]